jgi:hypothetical protein
VLAYRHLGKQSRRLGHVAHVGHRRPVGPAHVVAPDADDALHGDQTQESPEQRSLPGAVGSTDDDGLTGSDL